MDIPLEQFITTDLINKTEIYTMKVKVLYIPEYLVIDFMLMHEIDKMQKIENSKVQSHTIHKLTKIFSLGKSCGRKPS
jgi:NH3-dependent NAD+ synthetase